MDEPGAEIITIGDEILIGHIDDTNSRFLCKSLNLAGIKINKKSSVGDDETIIAEALSAAFQRSDIVITTGGLGPTKDDVTKKALCKYFGTTLRRDENSLLRITEYLRSKGREVNESNKQQADIPEPAKAIPNNNGTAPGIWMETPEGKVCISIPGIPTEMQALTEESLLPGLKQKFQPPHIMHKWIHTIGMGESELAEKLATWENALPAHIKPAYLPSRGIISLRLSATGKAPGVLEKTLEQETQKLKTYIPGLIFGYDENSKLEAVTGKLLRDKQATLATAESCTGGYIAHLMTSIAGSSAYFQGSVVAYANQVKENELGVNPATLASHGAVSEQTVIEMATHIRKKMNATYGIATSGIAGPSGGSEEKPVGTIWIACTNGKKTKTKKLQLFKNRSANIHFSAIYTLDLLRKHFLIADIS